MSEPLGLYLHVPFCRAKCRYCDFFSAPGDEAAQEAYTGALIRRIRALRGLAGLRPFSSVYFGGGTPTVLGRARLVRLLDAAADVGLAPDAEVSVEANPATVDRAGLAALRRAGFNRLSVGAQSFDPGELALLGRLHGPDDVRRTVSDAFAAGFENVSLDLMLGLPGQTVPRVLSSVRAALETGVSHLSAYCLKLEPGTPMAHDYPDGRGLPDGDETADAYLAAAAALSGAGLEQYEISNFARPGRACRHNLLYWTLGEYVGLGPSAHSDFGGRRFYFPRGAGFSAPFSSVFDGTLPEETDREEERVMLSLRTAAGLDLSSLAPETARAAAEVLSAVAARGLAAPTETGFRLTPEGFLVSNQIISEILLKGMS